MHIESKKDLYNCFMQVCNALQEDVDDREADTLIQALEQCREIFIKEKIYNSEVIVTLLYMYLCRERIYEACQLIAEYSISLEEEEEKFYDVMPKYISKKISSYNMKLSEIVYNQMIKSTDTYEDFFEIFTAYPDGRYAQLLIQYAREEDRRIDTIILSDAIKKTIKAEQDRRTARVVYDGEFFAHIECMMIAYYTERMEDLSYLRDYSEMRKCVLEAKRHYDYERETILNFSPEWLPRFWINMIQCLNILERFDRTIEISKSMEIKINDASYYFYIAEAYYSLGDMKRAEQNCKRSAGLEENQGNLLLLSQILFTKCDYKAAEKALLETIGIASRDIENTYLDNTKSYYAERRIKRKLHEIDFRKNLESPYALLFLCYVFQGELAKANAFFIEMKEKIGISDMVMISGHLLKVEEYAKKHLSEVENERHLLQNLLEDTTKKYDELKEVMNQWTKELIELQILDDLQEVDSDYWEEHISEKMNRMIENMHLQLNKFSVDAYEKKMKEINDKFPKMPDDAKKFLGSAEQMYEVFKGNVVIDFAPIMVEYCKVFEILIWNYLDKTGEYDVEIRNNTRKDKCLGTAEFVIRSAITKKTLSKYQRDIERITKLRNKSAHKEVTKEDPDVIWVNELIWKNDIVSLLCNV